MSEQEQSPLNTAGATPFRPFVGVFPIVVVVFTDIAMSFGLGRCTGTVSGGAVGPNEAVAASMERSGICTAGELGSWILWTLTVECADAVLELDESDENPLGSYQKLVCKAVRTGST
jgi:hypothetical protein